MIVHHLHIDNRDYVITSPAVMDSLQHDIIEAARAGAGFVHIPSASPTSVDVLITPASSIRIETRAVPDHVSTLDDDQNWQDHLFLDDYGHHDDYI